MKKLILSVFILLLISVSPILAADERWSDGDYEYNVQRQGNSITLTSTVPKIPRIAGIPNIVGTITGTTFSGKVYLVADECPNLDGYVPASGTVSADGSSITVIYNTTDYYYTTCVEKANSESEVTNTYSIASAANASPTLAPTIKPTLVETKSVPLDPNEFAKYLDEITDSNVESIAENPPASDDWNLQNPSGQSGEKLPESKIKPGSDTSWTVVSRGDPTKGYNITIESIHAEPTIIFPSGFEYSPSEGETIVVPLGSKIITDKFSAIYLSIQANGPVERFSMGLSSEVEIKPTDSSKVTEIKVNQGYVRFNTSTRTRVRVGRVNEEYTVNTKGTDFAVYFDPQTQQGAVEIYDKEVQVVSPNGREYLISSQYGSKMKRVEWGKGNVISEKTAVPKAIWKKFLAQANTQKQEQPKPAVTLNNSKTYNNTAIVSGLIGLFTFLLITLFWYRKKKGSLPLEQKVRLIIEKIKSEKK